MQKGKAGGVDIYLIKYIQLYILYCWIENCRESTYTIGIKDFPRTTKDLYMIYVLNVNVYSDISTFYTILLMILDAEKLKNH